MSDIDKLESNRKRGLERKEERKERDKLKKRERETKKEIERLCKRWRKRKGEKRERQREIKKVAASRQSTGSVQISVNILCFSSLSFSSTLLIMKPSLVILRRSKEYLIFFLQSYENNHRLMSGNFYFTP